MVLSVGLCFCTVRVGACRTRQATRRTEFAEMPLMLGRTGLLHPGEYMHVHVHQEYQVTGFGGSGVYIGTHRCLQRLV